MSFLEKVLLPYISGVFTGKHLFSTYKISFFKDFLFLLEPGFYNFIQTADTPELINEQNETQFFSSNIKAHRPELYSDSPPPVL